MGNRQPKLTFKEQMRQNRRAIERSIREIDRERGRLQSQEKKLIAEIKKMAKQDQKASVRIMAKDLVRTRNQVTKFYSMSTQLKAVNLKLATVQSVEAMNSALKGVTKAMVKMNQQLDLPALQQIMKEFCMESEKMEMTEDAMTDAVDMALGDADEEEETDKVVDQVLEEIGINTENDMGSVSNKDLQAQPVTTANSNKEENDVSDLEARLNNLRR
mmetsp:Transcript_15942/g.17808  ORF Transcript_15942/g.17808 Transcript_15942/m.17808 type:complete len:216 (+) Transcript_15942:133-780(+)